MQVDINPLKKMFANDGYCLVRGLFDKSEILKAAGWLREQDTSTLIKSWTDQEPGVPVAVHQGVHLKDTPVSRICNNSQMLDIAGQLIGNPVYVWSSKVNFKAAWCGTVEYYHQDLVYWKDRGYQTDQMLTCMVFADKHGMENGGLHVIPGSHKLGFLQHDPFININGLSKFMIPPATLDRLSTEHGLVCLEAEPGDVLFFHTNLVHGSAHNISGKPRMIFLSQLNSKNNKPVNLADNAKNFILKRTEMEIKEAQRKLDFFKKKYAEQAAASGPIFNSPTPPEEAY